jgi:hypothetical protein
MENQPAANNSTDTSHCISHLIPCGSATGGMPIAQLWASEECSGVAIDPHSSVGTQRL